MDPKELHDLLIEQMPAGAQHPSDCPLCVEPSTATKETASEEPEGRYGVTEAELKAALESKDAELAELRKQVSEFAASKTESELQAKIDAAVAEVQVKHDELQSQLDTAVLEAANEKQKREDLEAFLTAEAEKVAAAAEIASRKEERLAKVREAANFPEDYLAKHADRFAAMSDEDFESHVADWQAASGGVARPPKSTGLETTRETAAQHGSPSVLREVMGLRFQGVDTREIASRGVR